MPESSSNQKIPSRQTGEKVIYAALSLLKSNGGQMPYREMVKRLEQEVEFLPYETEVHAATGNVRWWALLQFYSIDCVKAGYITKKRRVWYLTPEGEEALKHGAEHLLSSAQAAYRRWQVNRQVDASDDEQTSLISNNNGVLQKSSNGDPDDPTSNEDREREVEVEAVEQMALQGLKNYLSRKNPYEFQDVVAALLRGMGYYTPFVSPRGKDGGVDVIAYRDPLGTVPPLIKVQVKHREVPANVQEIRQLMGLLQREREVGMFVSSGGFTPDARQLARDGHLHVELIDFERFISLWQEFYLKMDDADKSLLPLRTIYFLAPLND